MKEFIISEKEEGATLLKYCTRILPLSGQGMLRKFLRNKNIELNGKRSDGSEHLVKGDRVAFFLSDETFSRFHGQGKTKKYADPLDKADIIYEDSDILIYNKKAGLLSQSDISGEVSVNDMLLSYANPEGAFTPSICNRLDRNTSGIILAGVSSKGLTTLDKAIKARRIKKYYQCICEGIFAIEGPVKLFLKKDASRNISMITDVEQPGFDPVRTDFRVLETGRAYTLIEAELITGKPHQIRATLSHLLHPLAGDIKYGARKGIARRQLLHAGKVVFPKDILDGREFNAPLPEDMVYFIKEHFG